MRECILLFQFEQAKQRKLAAQLMMARFKVKAVGPEEMGLPVGYLAGNKEILPQEDEGEAVFDDSRLLDGEMLVMAGITPARMNVVLQAIRKAGIGPVPYKAIVTETNQYWKASDLFEELKKEHEAMKEAGGDGRMLHEKN